MRTTVQNARVRTFDVVDVLTAGVRVDSMKTAMTADVSNSRQQSMCDNGPRTDFDFIPTLTRPLRLVDDD